MNVVKQLGARAGDVDRACDLLQAPTPDALELCCSTLQAAAERLLALQTELAGAAGNAEALAEAWRLNRNVRRAEALLANAAAYHGQWRDLIAVKIAGYGPRGAAGTPALPGRLSVSG